MALGGWFSLHFYGPGAGAGIVAGAGVLDGTVAGTARAEGSASGVASVPLAKPTRLVNRPATITGAGTLAGTMRGRARMASTIRVNALSQDDVTGAVLETPIEPGLTLRQALRLIAAATAGKVSGASGSTVTIRSAEADHKNRIVATVDASGNRSAITTDLTD
jgi:hypothetical protein